MDASNWIALAALVVAILVAIRGESALRAERKDRKKEDNRRDEELELFRAQVGLQAEDRLSEKCAELVCRQRSHGGARQGVDEYEVVLLNAGRATAHEVKAWISTDAAEALSNPQRLGTIPRDQESPAFKLEISIEDSRNRKRRLFIRVSWADGAGEHAENLEELAAF